MTRQIIYIAFGIIILFVTLSFNTNEPAGTIKNSDKYALSIDSIIPTLSVSLYNCQDCFNGYIYYKGNEIYKIHCISSCYYIDFYYKNKKLFLVTLDGSFERSCGGTQAPYCWDSKLTRNYKDRIYYDNNKILKEIEFGSKPCCPIIICLKETKFSNKAQALLDKFGDGEYCDNWHSNIYNW